MINSLYEFNDSNFLSNFWDFKYQFQIVMIFASLWENFLPILKFVSFVSLYFLLKKSIHYYLNLVTFDIDDYCSFFLEFLHSVTEFPIVVDLDWLFVSQLFFNLFEFVLDDIFRFVYYFAFGSLNPLREKWFFSRFSRVHFEYLCYFRLIQIFSPSICFSHFLDPS